MQDRGHARLFFLAPVLKFVLALLWLISAIVGFLTGEELARTALAALGLDAEWAMPVAAATCLLDLAIAILILRDRRGRTATLVQLAVIAGYTIAFTVALPSSWLDPWGRCSRTCPLSPPSCVTAP